MSHSHLYTESVVAGSNSYSSTTSYTGSGRQTIGESLSAGTNTQVSFTLDVSAVKSFYIRSSTAATVKTNDSGSPADTLTLAADVPYVWNTDKLDTFLLGTDVTTLYVTNATDTEFEIDVITDATP